jgi:hypothetical protein
MSIVPSTSTTRSNKQRVVLFCKKSSSPAASTEMPTRGNPLLSYDNLDLFSSGQIEFSLHEDSVSGIRIRSCRPGGHNSVRSAFRYRPKLVSLVGTLIEIARIGSPGLGRIGALAARQCRTVPSCSPAIGKSMRRKRVEGRKRSLGRHGRSATAQLPNQSSAKGGKGTAGSGNDG